MHQLTKENTSWVFLLTSSDNVLIEDRHIRDILYGTDVLRLKGVNSKHIVVILDGPISTVSNSLIESIRKDYTLLKINEIARWCVDHVNENLVLFVTGHGCERGIVASPYITPFQLFHWIKNTRQVKRAIVYLGQCFAGVFNFMDVAQRRQDDQIISPEIIVIGATNLFPSLSAQVTIQTHSEAGEDSRTKSTWTANLFLFYLFQWILNPIDIDGDGCCTVADSYKYAGVLSNNHCSAVKGLILSAVLADASKINEFLKPENSSSPESDEAQLRRASVEERFRQNSKLHANHQEPWMLNSMPAQQIQYKL